MKIRIFKKLSSRSGETLVEVLVSVAITALAVLLLAGAISAAARLVDRSRDSLNDYYSSNNALAERSADDSDRLEGFISVTDNGDALALAPDVEAEIPAYIYIGQGTEASPIISYRIQEEP